MARRWGLSIGLVLLAVFSGVTSLAAGTDDLAVRLRAELLEFAQELNDVASRKGANLRQKVNEVFSDNNVGLRGSR